MMRVNHAAALCMLSAAMLSGTAAGQTMVLAHPFPKGTAFAPRVLSLICTDAFRQLNKDVEVRMFPPLRGSIEADAGSIDGEVGRAYGYGDRHPSLVRVEEALLSLRVAAFTRLPGVKINSWDSLKGTPYRVQYRSGYVTFKAHLEQVLPLAQISSVIDSQSGLKNIALGRADIFVDLEEFGEAQLAKRQHRYGELYNAGLVQDTPVYIYLHKRHAALAPRLAEIVAKMKTSGAIGHHRTTALHEERLATPP